MALSAHKYPSNTYTSFLFKFDSRESSIPKIDIKIVKSMVCFPGAAESTFEFLFQYNRMQNLKDACIYANAATQQGDPGIQYKVHGDPPFPPFNLI